MTNTTTNHTITAAELLPGDVVLAANGARAYAAFDVSHDDDTATVWTAISDQEAGKPARVEINHRQEVRVARRVTGSTTTRTTLTLHDDGSVAIAR